MFVAGYQAIDDIMDITRATRDYETWLAAHTRVAPGDFTRKHSYMARPKNQGLFLFFRATFYRWAQLWPALCPELAQAPAVLSVGDLHVENFGTWRNTAERLVWGVNDLDEAYPLPYTNDLVRLAASAELARRADQLDCSLADACASILGGYADGLRVGGSPYILEGAHDWLLRLVSKSAKEPKPFWEKLLDLPHSRERVPTGALELLEQLLPEPNLAYAIVHREAGVGSLGRQRWAALAEWGGSWVVREVKALAPSACQWAARAELAEPLVAELLRRAVRSPDAYMRVTQGWITRRLAPDSQRIDLDMLSGKRAQQLLYAMGMETANMHLGSPPADGVLLDLGCRPARWLERAAEVMLEAIEQDWRDWRRWRGES